MYPKRLHDDEIVINGRACRQRRVSLADRFLYALVGWPLGAADRFPVDFDCGRAIDSSILFDELVENSGAIVLLATAHLRKIKALSRCTLLDILSIFTV